MTTRRIVVAVALLAAIAAGCSFPKSAVPAPDASPAPAGVPSSDQTNVSPYPDLARLGAWNGTTFVSYGGTLDVTPIVGGHVIVMTHGWAVGWLDTYETAQANSSTLVPFWDPAFTDPTNGELLSQNFLDLAGSLQAADPTATILMYSWIDQSSTPLSGLAAYAPERATEINGHRMATAIDALLAPGFAAAGGEVHLIGHSFGANVATTAALALSDPPRQLTLFDSPEVELARFGGAKNDLRYKLPRLDIGRTAGTTFVDNYISEVGEEFHVYPGLEDVVDVRLAPPSSDNGGQRHEYPIGWYADTVTALGTSAQQVGYAWSPLIGADDSGLAPMWKQSVGSADSTGGEPYEPIGDAPIAGVSSQWALETAPLTLASGTAAITVDPSSVTNVEFTSTSDSLWLTFDLEPGVGVAPVDLYVDGRLRSTFEGPSSGTGASGRFVILYDVDPGDHTLSVVSTGLAGDSTPCCPSPTKVSNLAIVSTTDIERNLTPGRIRGVVRWVIAIVVVLALLVLALVIWLIVVAVRLIRRRINARRAAAQ